ncbi:MAG: UDP-N-acetylmuramoyl-L-alanine--D-glutamate ligase [bacterium]|nr:UDP-N-acetylmuramoyl-L-alanine--D-glutamate ligase [bacterium]
MARSGIGAARLIHRLGGRALISDRKSAELLGPAIEELQGLGIEVEAGEHRRIAAETFDLVVLSPGVVPNREWLDAWQRQGVRVISELQLAAEVCDSLWIGVTGSNGKTTTVHLIASMLEHAGMSVQTAGNVGWSWSDFLPAPPKQVFVVEVSSFQLEFCPRLQPDVGVFLNLFENHLDRHGNMDTYAELKSRLFVNQQPDNVVVLNGEDRWIAKLDSAFPARHVRFGTQPEFDFRTTREQLRFRADQRDELLIERDEFPLVGRHNELNALAAAAAAMSVGARVTAIREALRQAKPVEHRIEFVGTFGGAAYYNDSKSTNLTATLTALDSFERNVILLFGGRPKKEPFAPLALRYGRPINALLAFGEAAPKVRRDVPEDYPMILTETLSAAVARAREIAGEGDIVLLSPGCTSFDEFTNFEERGRVFKSLVQS